jgi:hypothetical protein
MRAVVQGQPLARGFLPETSGAPTRPMRGEIVRIPLTHIGCACGVERFRGLRAAEINRNGDGGVTHLAVLFKGHGKLHKVARLDPAATRDSMNSLVFTLIRISAGNLQTIAGAERAPASRMIFEPKSASCRVVMRGKHSCAFRAKRARKCVRPALGRSDHQETRWTWQFWGPRSKLAHVQAAVDAEDLAGDVGGFVAREEDDGGGDFSIGAEAAERDERFHFFLQLG